jgi:hypothetical protein
MAYSPVCKSKNKKLNNESLLEDIRNSIDKEYREAVQSDDWSNYEFVYEMYRNYKLNGGNSEYVKSIVKRYQSQYTIKGIERTQRDCISRMINIALNDTRKTETVYTESVGKKPVEFNKNVYNTNMSQIAETIEGTELDCYNIAETVKPKSFEEMSYEEKIKFVNKQIDDLLDFIERNKQAKYDKWRKGISI